MEIEQKIMSACKDNLTMMQAAKSIEMPYTTFIRKAKKMGIYEPNRGGRGTRKKSPPNKVLLSKIISGKLPYSSSNRLRKRLIDEGVKEAKCEVCGISTWMGSDVSLELHHMDGNRNNHLLKNLQIVCPNCHSQTHSYRGKNIKR